MRRHKLDKIDKKILETLQANGKITNVDLSKSVGISAPPCLRRVKALEEAGFIKSYHAKLDHSALGFGVTVFAMIKLGTQAAFDHEATAFIDWLKQSPAAAGFDTVQIAGDAERLTRIKREREGIEVDEHTWQEIVAAGKKVGVVI